MVGKASVKDHSTDVVKINQVEGVGELDASPLACASISVCSSGLLMLLWLLLPFQTQADLVFNINPSQASVTAGQSITFNIGMTSTVSENIGASILGFVAGDGSGTSGTFNSPVSLFLPSQPGEWFIGPAGEAFYSRSITPSL